MSKATDRLRFGDFSEVWHFSVLVHGQCTVCFGRHSQFVHLFGVREPGCGQGIAAIRTVVDDQDFLYSSVVAKGLSTLNASQSMSIEYFLSIFSQ